MASLALRNSIRKYHRWLGFFLAGIMALYAFSGILLIMRTTDFLQYEQTKERQLPAGLDGASLGPELRLRDFRVLTETSTRVEFANGSYDKSSGVASVTVKDYPPVIGKVVKLHKATTNSPLFFLNVFFGLSLLFFTVSAFLMFLPRLPQFKSGIRIAAAGFVFALLVVTFGSG